MFVSPDWAGRIWGRTNCSFNADGSGPSTYSGVDGYGAACVTGDCLGKLDCLSAGRVPATLAEFTLQGGSAHNQTFYDISLVDGYNLPLAIIYHPDPSTSWIPPNLTNCACIASAGYISPPGAPAPPHPSSSSSFQQDSTKPGSVDGAAILPLPPPQACLSACSRTHAPADCCTGPHYGSSEACEPGPYARRAKRVCPDAYSFPFDDVAGTFVVPAFFATTIGTTTNDSTIGDDSGSAGSATAGWEVRFCPQGRSTDILATFGDEMRTIGAGRGLTAEGWRKVKDKGYGKGHWKTESVDGGRARSEGVVRGAVMTAVAAAAATMAVVSWLVLV
ncbi:putative thaumatin family protein [Corynascus novoguineensis]|uniref:Thaumatin family protein n=1 Tax=Corynascus novoguineensis TaxID=1126955 RepID=A0AAN7CRH7_9PEZI|nr:putative thaumatin family protein [Corynascus novoguineensis]